MCRNDIRGSRERPNKGAHIEIYPTSSLRVRDYAPDGVSDGFLGLHKLKQGRDVGDGAWR